MRLALRIMLLSALLVLLAAACGTAAEPRPTFAPTNTGIARVNLEETAESATEEGESVAVAQQPSATALPPSSSPAPTEAPTEAPTAAPTELPTEEATALPTEEAADAGGAVVEVNGLVGDASNGEALFRFFPNPETSQYCLTCHNPDEALPGAGPYLYGIASVAGERVEGMSAIDYLHESIIDPNLHIAPPQTGPEGNSFTWVEGVMPQNWGDVLDEQQIADLVAYLMSLDQPLDG